MYLVDTNVLSEPTKRTPNPRALQWLAAQHRVLVSTVSIMELEHGIAAAPDAKQPGLHAWLEALLQSPAHELVAVDTAVARLAGQMLAERRAAGRPRPLADVLVAACARSRGAIIASRNVTDFDGLGVPVLNPFA